MSSAAKYLAEIKDSLGYHAAWLPNINLQLGDVGVLQGDWFHRRSDLTSLGLPFETRLGEASANFSHRTPQAVSLFVKAQGETPIANIPLGEAEAGIVVKFDQESAIVFDAIGCITDSIADFERLRRDVEDLYYRGDWERDLVVITEIVKAHHTTVLVSSSTEAQAVLHASGKFGAQGANLANAEAELSLKESKHVSTQIVSEKNLTPLFRLSRLKRRFFDLRFSADAEVSEFPFDSLQPSDGENDWFFDPISYPILKPQG